MKKLSKNMLALLLVGATALSIKQIKVSGAYTSLGEVCNCKRDL